MQGSFAADFPEKPLQAAPEALTVVPETQKGPRISMEANPILERLRGPGWPGHRPTARPSPSAVWKYKAICRLGDEQVGQWSDEAPHQRDGVNLGNGQILTLTGYDEDEPHRVLVRTDRQPNIHRIQVPPEQARCTRLLDLSVASAALPLRVRVLCAR